MKTIAVIPARYNSTRLPGKMMLPLGDKPLIQATYNNIVDMNLFDEVLVATDSEIIFEAISKQGGSVVMSRENHETGSDRIAEVVAPLDVDIVVNVQGDEPFIEKQPLMDLLDVFQQSTSRVDVATLKMPLQQPQDIANPNNVKVVCDAYDFALYFSRAVLPYLQSEDSLPDYFQHIGVYAFRKQALLDFAQLPMRPNEKAEKIECLRYLEYGMKIKAITTQHSSIGIDTAEDLEKAKAFLKSRK